MRDKGSETMIEKTKIAKELNFIADKLRNIVADKEHDIDEAFYLISDSVDDWENNRKEQALKNILIFFNKSYKIIDEYISVKITCGSDSVFDKKLIYLLAKGILSDLYKRENLFKRALVKWNQTYKRLNFINDSI